MRSSKGFGAAKVLIGLFVLVFVIALFFTAITHGIVDIIVEFFKQIANIVINALINVIDWVLEKFGVSTLKGRHACLPD